MSKAADFEMVNYNLNKKELSIERRNLQLCFNKVRHHNRYETNIHYLIKAILTKLIINKKDAALGEMECRNGRIIDVLQAKQNGEFIAYEIENEKNTKKDIKGIDTIEIKIKDLPEDIILSINQLFDYFENEVV